MVVRVRIRSLLVFRYWLVRILEEEDVRMVYD